MTMKLAGAAVIAAALSATAGAQGTQMKDSAQHMDMTDMKTEAYVGCVAASQSADIFILKPSAADAGMNTAMKRSMHDAAMEAASSTKKDTMSSGMHSPHDDMRKPMSDDMKTPAANGMQESTMNGDGYRLAGSHLKNYVGRTVSVKGSLTKGGGHMGVEMPTLKVKSIKVLSGVCSQAD